MRPIIAAVRGLEDDAVFTPDGSGKWPDFEEDDEDNDWRMERISDRLQADVTAFFERQGRASPLDG